MVVPGVLHLVDEPDADFAGTVRVAERVKVQLDFAHEVISGYDACGDVVADLLPFVAVVGVFAFPVGVLAGERDGDVDFGRDCEPCALAGRVDCGVLVVAFCLDKRGHIVSDIDIRSVGLPGDLRKPLGDVLDDLAERVENVVSSLKGEALEDEMVIEQAVAASGLFREPARGFIEIGAVHDAVTYRGG